ncbi:MAG: hypothetical protein ACKVT2_17265 [Saprospiraceae bacterium]
MLRPSFLSQFFIPLVFLFLFNQQSFAQISRPFRYSSEIGLDFASFARGEPGLILLYKRGLGNSADPERHHQFALRLQLGYYEDGYTYSNFLRPVGDTTFSIEGSGRSKHSFIRIGAEFQARISNFRLYAGPDLGYRQWTSKGESKYLSHVGGMSFTTEEFEHDNKANVVEGSIFVGMQYFFLPRFSVGLEANASLGLEFSNSKTLKNGMLVISDTGSLIEFDVVLGRLLYLSYHFGK